MKRRNSHIALLGLPLVLLSCSPGPSSGTDSGLPDAAFAADGPMDSAPAHADALPADMVLVPAGPFPRGCDATKEPRCETDEVPLRTLHLSAFYIDRTEVTWAAYDTCVHHGRCAPIAGRPDSPAPDHPVRGVTWGQAQSFCAARGQRLPTEAEWEKAARGTDGRRYPWGDAEPDCRLALVAGCEDSAVGKHPAGASPYGALDMAGSALEWVADFYDAGYYAPAPAADPAGPPSGSSHVLRGGSDGLFGYTLRAAQRYAYPPDLREIGLRCARSAQ